MCITLALPMVSCGHKLINATYTFKGEVHGKTYNMQLTLNKSGAAHLKMLDRPIIEDLSDRQWLPELYNKGLYGHYRYDKDCKCYYATYLGYREIKNVWYDIDALDFVKGIYIGNDGYLYFTREKFSHKKYDYEIINASSDVKNKTNRGPKYTKYHYCPLKMDDKY